MKNIVFYDNCIVWYEDFIALGGSETFLNEISKRFSDFGYNVYIISKSITHDVANYNVHFVNINDAVHFFENIEIDIFIIFRSSKGLDDIYSKLKIKRTFASYTTIQGDFINDYYLSKIDGAFFVSECCKCLFSNKSPILWDKKGFIIPNGVDDKLYSDKLPKRNMCVYSSQLRRGLKYTYNIYKIIKKSVPDFELVVCRPQYDNNDAYFEYIKDGVIFLGNLSKERLANIQKESKIWIYKANFLETFCITAMENIYADNVPIVTYNPGMNDYLDGFDLFYNSGYKLLNVSDEKIASDAIKVLTDDEYRLKLLDKLKPIKERYSWDDVARQFEDVLLTYYK